MIMNSRILLVLVFIAGSGIYAAQEPKITGPKASSPVIRQSDGTLVTACAVGENWEVVSLSSTDNGSTWQPAVKGERRNAYRMLLDSDGQMHAIFMYRYGKGKPADGIYTDLYHAKTYKDPSGQTKWNKAALIWHGYIGSLCCDPIQLQSGRIILSFAYWLADVLRGPPFGNNISTTIYTDDGVEWKQSPAKLISPCKADYNGDNVGAVEPVVIELKDGRVWMLMRTQADYLYESYSTDGVDWEPARPSRFNSSTGPAQLCRVDDKIVLLWNNCQMPPKFEGQGVYAGRDVLHAAVTDDEGDNWYGFREVYVDPTRHESSVKSGDRGTAYPIQRYVNDGKLHFVAGQGAQLRVEIILDPDWLFQTSRSDDFSDGINNWSAFKPYGPAVKWWRARTQGPRIIDHPSKPGAKVLHVRKPDEKDPDGAVWNFPAGHKGILELEIMLNDGFKGCAISLADRFFEPTDINGLKESVYRLIINSNAMIGDMKLVTKKWYKITYQWDNPAKQCKVLVDGVERYSAKQMNPVVNGCSYLLLRSMADGVDNGGFYVQSVKAQVDGSQAAETNAPVVLRESPENEAAVVKLPDGELKIFYIAKNKTQIDSIRSKDNGKSWDEPEMEFELPGNAYYALEVIFDRDNELHCIFHIRGEGDNGYNGRHYNLWHCRTTDGRAQWTKPTEFYNGYVGSIRGFIQLPNGRLLVSVSIAVPHRVKKPDSGIDYGWHDIVGFYSDDNGLSWKTSPSALVVEQDNSRGLTRYGGIEPHLGLLKDGRIWMLARTKNGWLYESYSNDNGHTWSDLVKTRFISSDSPAQLQRLDDGRLLLLLNVCQKWDDLRSYAIGGREVLHAAISDDDGKTWYGFREIMYAPDIAVVKGDRGTAYATTAQMNDGRIIVVSGQGEGQRSVIAFAPQWLSETSINDDFNGEKYWTAYGSFDTAIAPHPDNATRKALHVYDMAGNLSSGMVYNFPMMTQGTVKLKIKPSGEVIRAALTDNFSVVNDTLANDNANFPFELKLRAGVWNDIEIKFNNKAAQIITNGNAVDLPIKRDMIWGVNYLRLICMPDEQPEGFYIESLSITQINSKE